jgi:hypothetical protein
MGFLHNRPKANSRERLPHSLDTSRSFGDSHRSTDSAGESCELVRTGAVPALLNLSERCAQCALPSLDLPALAAGLSSTASSSCAALALATWVASCDGTGSILFSRM